MTGSGDKRNVGPSALIDDLLRCLDAEASLAKILKCAEVDPSSGCTHVVRGETEAEVLKKAGEHAAEHGIRDVTPQLIDRIKTKICDA